MAGIAIMNTLRQNITDYLATRRAMGFKVEGLSKLLLSFVAFCEARGATRVRNDLALEWAGDGHSVFMTGPATEVFSGEWGV